ncbi:hypothetical protein BDD12DRAFT_824617, partial [Trichophaea hybrida]
MCLCFRRVVDFFCKYASDTIRPILAVKPLKKALLRSNPAHFSFMHTLFTRLCLQARCYRDAMPVLDVDVFDFPASKGAKDIDLNGRASKWWRRAMDYLCYVVAFPGNACSIIQVEAYKKFILHSPWPSKAGDIPLFRQEIELTREVFAQDENTGLATQCIHAFRRMQIVALKDTYVTLSVGEIAQKNFDETERVILGMIERGEISATLSQDPSTSQTTVHFDSSPVEEARNLAALEEQIQRIVALNQQ